MPTYQALLVRFGTHLAIPDYRFCSTADSDLAALPVLLILLLPFRPLICTAEQATDRLCPSKHSARFTCAA